MTFLWMVIGLCYFAIWTVVMKNSKMNTTTFCFFYNYIQALFFKNIYIFIYLTGQVFLVAQGTFTASWEIFSCSTQTLSLCHVGSGAHELSSCGAPVSFFMEWQLVLSHEADAWAADQGPWVQSRGEPRPLCLRKKLQTFASNTHVSWLLSLSLWR